jgi:hypothetical protein
MKFTPQLALFLLLIGCYSTQSNQNTGDWIQLFNGKDLTGWTPKITGYPFGENFGNTFSVDSGMMKVRYNAYDSFSDRFGHIFYKDKFSQYVLRVEYRFTGEQAKGGPGWAIRNSGAMLHCQDPKTMTDNQDFPISIEVQLLGGNGKDERSTANLCTPGTNVVMNKQLITDHCISSRSKTFHGSQWVTLEVLVLGDSLVRHIVNKEIVLEYQQPQVGGGNVSNHNASVKKDGTLLTEGFISLQSESHPVDFRKVELFNLEPFANDHAKLAAVLRELNIP